MTPAGDYVHEMPTFHEIDDATAEAVLTGGPVAADFEPLLAAVAAYRRVSARPVRPSPALAAQMAAGVFTGAAEPYPPPVATAGRPVRRLDRPARRAVRAARGPVGRGRHVRTPARRLVGRFARAGTAAKAIVAVGVAIVGTATAGFAGALPDPAQQRFETVVETVTPYHFPAKTGPGGGPGEQVRNGPADGGEVGEGTRGGGERRPEQLPTQMPASPGQPSEVPAPGDPTHPDDPPTPDDGPPTPEQADDPGPPETPPAEQRRPTAPPGQ